ncbi:hypothetical protein J6TS1_19910 [Siminovitchia terrae]|uniref:DUF4469 domain-containing protein n=1 Tax=Siminovitchia terrae TaxID=1914933 RepID=A0ABQ4KVR4_SIMTE|nr:hypothetical protein [Siminovitchia terrae]GIN96121.1 hypothetical protein J6TS1_19910 [Siminovitchia terrae]
MNKSSELTLTIAGDEFDDGYNLFYLNKSLTNLHTLIDKAYLTIEGKSKMMDSDRENMQIKAYNIRSGSFETDLIIKLATVTGSMLPIVTSLTPSDILNLVTQSYTFLKTILSGNAKGEKYFLDAGDNSNLNVINGSGNIVLQVHPDVLDYVKRAENNFEDLSRMIDPKKGVKNISVVDKKKKTMHFFMGVEERMLFDNKKRIDPDPVSFKGMIVKVDGESFNGKLKVLEGNKDIPEGEYSFEYLVKDSPIKLKDAFMDVRKITAMKETVLNPSTLEQRIYKLKIIETA